MNKESTIHNVITILIVMVISFVLTALGDGAHNSGMPYKILLIVPIGITIITISLYYFSRYFTQKNNWIISAFGILLLLVYGIRIFFNL